MSSTQYGLVMENRKGLEKVTNGPARIRNISNSPGKTEVPEKVRQNARQIISNALLDFRNAKLIEQWKLEPDPTKEQVCEILFCIIAEALKEIDESGTLKEIASLWHTLSEDQKQAILQLARG